MRIAFFVFIGFVFAMRKNLYNFVFCSLCFISLACFSACQEHRAQTKTKEAPPELLGTWVLTNRIIDGQDTPVQERLIKLTFKKEGVFQASYKGEPRQAWISAGRGAFVCNPPMLSLFWDSGRVVPLLIGELTSERLRVHHGRNTVPIKDQEPDEIFQKAPQEKGPTKGGAS